MDFQPIDDPNDDCPRYGGPIVELPPDTSYGAMFITSQMPKPWHYFPWIKNELWKVATGRGIKVAVLDTGYSKHEMGPEPIAARSFISGQSWRDGNGHGCISPTDEVYTSNCGLQAIETFFNRMSGVAHFLADGSIIKDISRYNIFTFSLDTSGDVPKQTRNRITHVHKLQHDGDVFQVAVNGETLTLTPWHPVYVEVSSTGKKRRIAKKRADELKVGDKVCLMPKSDQGISEEILQIPTSSNSFIPLDEKLAMWIGLLLTDGHLTKRQKSVQFSSADDRHIDLFASLTHAIFGMMPKVYSHRTAKSVRCHGIPWIVASAFMPVGAKSKTVDLPELIAKSPRNVIESFFAGCIEGDGCTSGGKVRITTGSEKFASKVCRLLSSLGIRCSRSSQTGDKSNFGGGPWWVICIGAWPELAKKLRVKKAKEVTPKGNLSSAITSIVVKHYKGSLYDFTVEGSHNYIANGLVVSNTHVAGTVLCRRDDAGNSIGLAPDAELLVGKVLSNEGSGGSDGIAAGIRWAADQGAHVISMSLGGGGPDTGTNQAIDYAWSKGCIVNASAGNSGYNGQNTIGWPAKYENCMCCGAYAQNGSISSFSSGGRELDWACPGSNIISFATNGLDYRDMSGTSMSCPFGSGLLACLVEVRLRQGYPLFTSAKQVTQYFDKALKDAGQPGFDVRFGNGIANGEFLVEAIIKELTAA